MELHNFNRINIPYMETLSSCYYVDGAETNFVHKSNICLKSSTPTRNFIQKMFLALEREENKILSLLKFLLLLLFPPPPPIFVTSVLILINLFSKGAATHVLACQRGMQLLSM